MKLLIQTLVVIALLTGLVAVCTSCPTNPDAEKAVQEKVKVPGLDEAILAKDRTIKSAIMMTWTADVELAQEQLAVEDVHAGKVRITGVVSREELKERAEQAAKEIDGVVDVVSTITVDESLQENRINLGDM
ncbi:BON domain-containing protein [bacterium]|nr:BON domain-containing protein [bacterium]